jgi:hypothetical protein
MHSPTLHTCVEERQLHTSTPDITLKIRKDLPSLVREHKKREATFTASSQQEPSPLLNTYVNVIYIYIFMYFRI